MSIDWDGDDWGSPATCVHIGITDDLGDHGRHSDDAEDER